MSFQRHSDIPERNIHKCDGHVRTYVKRIDSSFKPCTNALGNKHPHGSRERRAIKPVIHVLMRDEKEESKQAHVRDTTLLVGHVACDKFA